MKHLPKSFTLARIESGKLIANKQAIARDSAKMKDGDVSIEIKPYVRSKTWEQIKTFHGPIVEQVKEFIEDTEGECRTEERIKDDLKSQFLKKEKQFYSDGTPVMIKMAHPEKKGVFYMWHFEKVPSLADLDVETFNAFITDILSWFQHERGKTIVIESREK